MIFVLIGLIRAKYVSLRIKFSVMKNLMVIVFLTCFLWGCKKEDSLPEEPKEFSLISAKVGLRNLDLNTPTFNLDIPIADQITLEFSAEVDGATAENGVKLLQDGDKLTYTLAVNQKTIKAILTPVTPKDKSFSIVISNALKSTAGSPVTPKSLTFSTEKDVLSVSGGLIDGKNLLSDGRLLDIIRKPEIKINFSKAVNPGTVTENSISLTSKSSPAKITLTFENDQKTVVVTPSANLNYLERYTLTLQNTIKGADGSAFTGFNKSFYTAIDLTPKFPIITDEELLTLVQRQTFRYFWDLGAGSRGLAPERNTSPNTIAVGGTGFGVMAIIVAIERGFITRLQGIERLNQILDFLNIADRFHGVFPHWLNATNGKVIPFSANDNGADLIETSYLMQGLLTVRQYMNPSAAQEQTIIDKINVLWDAVEWDWFRRGNQDVLYWHWSPDKEWIMNFPIVGYNEGLIPYFLAASSRTHAINAEPYTKGFMKNGAVKNGKTHYNHILPLGENLGGPLFFAHYSFLGLDPRQLEDQFANFWDQNRNHSLINHAYCVANPKQFIGYSADCWGLTASDNASGYSAHSPTNDLGVITPTAALSSFPYTPQESMQALKFFYYTLGDRIWKDYGFVDAFDLEESWYANSFLAIDQGPIIVMIENHRTGLLWDLFMSCPEVQQGKRVLGFK